MDFIIGLPMIVNQHDSIMVMVEEFSMETHFILVKSMHKTSDIARIFMKEIFRLHGLPKVIVSNQDAKFTSNFSKGLFQYLGT